MPEFVLDIPEFVLTLIGFDLNMTGFVLNMTEVVPNMTVFVLYKIGFVKKKGVRFGSFVINITEFFCLNC